MGTAVFVRMKLTIPAVNNQNPFGRPVSFQTNGAALIFNLRGAIQLNFNFSIRKIPASIISRKRRLANTEQHFKKSHSPPFV